MIKDEKHNFEKNIVQLMEENFPVKLILDTISGNLDVSVVSGYIKGYFADYIHIVRDATNQESKDYGTELVGIDVPISRIVSITSYARKE